MKRRKAVGKAGGDGQIWLSQAQAARLVGLGQRQFREAIAPRLDGEEVKGSGAKKRYLAGGAVRARVEQVQEQLHHEGTKRDPAALMRAAGTQTRSVSEEELLDETKQGGSLERLRSATADLREMERDERRRQMVRRDRIEQGLLAAAELIRRAGEMLVRQFGNAAGEILNGAIDEAVGQWRTQTNGTADERG